MYLKILIIFSLSLFSVLCADEHLLKLLNQKNNTKNIAIDIGAKDGRTSKSLSKLFYHVLAVESDREQIKKFQSGMAPFSHNNISLCKHHIGVKQKGAPGTITFKELLHGYIFDNERVYPQNPRYFRYANVSDHLPKVSFIRCDVDGEEEDLIEDILFFAYHNKSTVFIHFNMDHWKALKISDFSSMLEFFSIKHLNGDPCVDICEYLKTEKSCALIFEPIAQERVFIKKNIPVVIIGYNLLTFIKNMVEQVEKYTSDIIIIDNKSTFPPLLEYYAKEYKYTLLRQKENFGHRVFTRESIQKLMGDVYVITDPDLRFNPNLPSDFINELVEISCDLGAARVGFALCIDANDLRDDLTFADMPLFQFESLFWQDPIFYPKNPSMKLYQAAIDTTFCVINRKNEERAWRKSTEGILAKYWKPPKEDCIRVAGNYTCKHLPWHKNFQAELLPGEFEHYLKNNKSTNFFK